MAKKVLIVEDNELNLKLFTDLLAAHGYAIEGVRDGRLVEETARAFGPDLIVMDIQLPNMSGLDLIRRLKDDEDLGSVPIMAVTAFAAKGDEERIRAAGAQAYVAKPVTVKGFLREVEAQL